MDFSNRGASSHNLTSNQQVSANILIQQLKNNPSIIKINRQCNNNNNNNGYNKYHWTFRLKQIWFERINSNAECMKPLKDIYLHDSKWLYKIKHLDSLYSNILRKLNKIEDISYSRHYILQLHLSHIFDELLITNNKCVKHADIQEYKDMDIEMEECFCNSFNGIYPKFCLYCRNSCFFNYKYLR